MSLAKTCNQKRLCAASHGLFLYIERNDMNIYLESGYLDYHKIVGLGFPLTIVYGGRGTGKTYGALKEELIDHPELFLFMRRTKTQLGLIKKPELSPLGPINNDFDRDFTTASLGSDLIIWKDEDEEPVGYGVALNTVSNIRGFEASGVKRIIYDEFIPEKHERPIKNEFDALMNAWETVNRNREIKGEAPCQLVMLSNSNDLANPVFMALGLVRIALRMREKGQNIYQDKKRGILLVDMQASPISERKRETAIYKLTQGTEFSRMALDNAFVYEDISENIRSRDLTAYRPIVTVGEITIYRHKSERLFYVCRHRQGSPETYSSGETDLKRFRRKHALLWSRHLDGLVEFEDYTDQVLFQKYLGMD